MRKKHLIVFIFFLLQITIAEGQPYAINQENINTLSPTDYPIYIDSNAKLNIQNISNQNFESLFVSSLNDLNKLKSSSFWFIINIEQPVSQKVLQIYFPNANNLSAYTMTSNNRYKQLIVSRNRNDFYIIKANNKNNFILVNIQTTKYFSLILKIFTSKEFFLKERKLNLYYGFIIGVFLLLSLYHLVLFLKVSDRLYLYYIILILTSGLLAIPHSGFIDIKSNLYYDIVFASFQIACILIGSNYLNFYNRNKKIVQASIIIVLFANTYGIISPSIFGKYLSHVICIFIYLSILYLTILQIKSKNKSSFWFLFPWITILFAHIYYLLNLNLIFYYRQSIEVGLLANICFMALAIGNKLNIYKDQKRIAESKELQAFAERDRIIHEQNKILEQLIQERNKKILEKNLALSEKKKEIEEKNVIINETNQRLRQINQELLNKNNEILSQNQELRKHHELLEIIVNKRTKRLLAAKERAIVADKLKTSFLNNLTQEINTPMNSITGFANLLNDKNLTKEKRNEYLLSINKNVEVLLESIDNVVILAKIQARILKAKSKQFRIKELIDKCLEIFTDRLNALGRNEPKFQIENTNIENGEIILSDYEKIWQILYKLVDNSVKFTEKGYIRIKYGLQKSAAQNTNYNLTLNIEDSGIGIKKEKLNYILERFSNIEDDKTMLYHETGIGLAIVKGLIDILKGKIQVHSIPGTGTSFYIEIPVAIKSSVPSSN